MTKEEFQQDIENWDNHRLLLWPALEATKHLGLPVLELGCGHGSTKYLRQYCLDNGLELHSYDYSAEYAAKFGGIHVTNWETQVPWRKDWGVVLVDHSPGEHRKIAISKLHHAKVVVIHDSEPAGWNASDYQVTAEIEKFKFILHIEPAAPQAWTTGVSNEIDVFKIFII